MGLAENEEFGKIFSKFSLARAAQEAEEEERLQQEDTVMEIDEQDTKQEPKPEWLRDSDDDDEEEDDDKPISKKKQKKLSRYTVAQLKTLVKKAEHVEVQDYVLLINMTHLNSS